MSEEIENNQTINDVEINNLDTEKQHIDDVEIDNLDTEKQHDLEHCKICRDEGTAEEPLFTPCKCIGSIGKIHEQCLYNWIMQKLNIHDIESYIKKDAYTGRLVLLKNIDVKCDICRSPYTFQTLYKSDNIKDLSWSQFLAPLYKKLKNAITFGVLFFLVGLIVFVIVPNYWILLRNFLEKVVNSFFKVNTFRDNVAISTKNESVEATLPATKTWKRLLNIIMVNSYRGILDIVFVGLVVLSIYFSQDLINSEYIFKEMILQKMGHLDVVDLKRIIIPLAFQVESRCLYLLKGVQMDTDSFSLNLSVFITTLRSEMTDVEIEAFIKKSVKDSSDEITETLAKTIYYIPTGLPETIIEQLKASILAKFKNKAQSSTLLDLFKGSKLFEQFGIKVGGNNDNNLNSDVQSDNEHGSGDNGQQLHPRDLFLASSEEDHSEEEDDVDSNSDEEYQPHSHENSTDDEEEEEEDSGHDTSDDEHEENQGVDQQVNLLLNQLRQEVDLNNFQEPVADAEDDDVDDFVEDGAGFNMLTIRFSFKNLPKYCLIGCGIASVVLFLGFSIPYFFGRMVITALRFSLKFLNIFAAQVHYKSFSLEPVVSTFIKILDYENHPTFRRVIPSCAFFILVSLFIIAYVWALEHPPKPYKTIPLKDRSIYKIVFHIKQLLKTYIIISIELLVFPIMSGMMIDFSFIAPLILNQNKNEKMKLLAVYEVLSFLPSFVQVICHAAIGTIYMLSMATFIGMIRSKILRNGVLYFVRSPEDPNRKILRDCLATSFRLQFRKLSQSMLVYMGFIFGGFGITTRIVLPTIYDSFNKTKPLVAFFIFENKITLFRVVILGACLNLCYLSFKSNKQKASKDLESIWRRFFKISCKRLRLSHYILNDSNIDERGSIVYRNWYYKFLNPKEAEFSNLELFTEPKTLDECANLFKEVPDVHCYFVPNGNFYRVPGSDILSTKFIRTLFVVVTKTDKLIHSREVRPRMGYRGEFDNLIKESENFDKYDVIYCPPNFFRRSIALLIEVNLFAIFFIVTGVLLSNFIGQFIIYNLGQVFFGDNVLGEFNKDGVYFEFVCLGFGILLDTIYRVSKPIKIDAKKINDLKNVYFKGTVLALFLILKYLSMAVAGLLLIQPINYLIYLVFDDWKNIFGKDNFIKASVVWFALNLFSMLRPHIVTVEGGEEQGERQTIEFNITAEEGPLMNMSIPSICYSNVLFYSPEGFLPEIVALLVSINIKVFVTLYINLRASATVAVTNKFSLIFIGVSCSIAMLFRFTKYMTQLRRNYENEILFEARILQNAEDEEGEQ